jgi:acetyl-CoA C-acetyltransferase
VTAGDPVIMLEEPLFATDRALQAAAGMKIDDIDLYEVNEAFAGAAGLAQAYRRRPEKLNVNGAIALGHPLGASGTKLMSTLIHAARGQEVWPADDVRRRRRRQRHHRRGAVIVFRERIENHEA